MVVKPTVNRKVSTKNNEVEVYLTTPKGYRTCVAITEGERTTMIGVSKAKKLLAHAKEVQNLLNEYDAEREENAPKVKGGTVSESDLATIVAEAVAKAMANQQKATPKRGRTAKAAN